MIIEKKVKYNKFTSLFLEEAQLTHWFRCYKGVYSNAKATLDDKAHGFSSKFSANDGVRGTKDRGHGKLRQKKKTFLYKSHSVHNFFQSKEWTTNQMGQYNKHHETVKHQQYI